MRLCLLSCLLAIACSPVAFAATSSKTSVITRSRTTAHSTSTVKTSFTIRTTTHTTSTAAATTPPNTAAIVIGDRPDIGAAAVINAPITDLDPWTLIIALYDPDTQQHGLYNQAWNQAAKAPSKWIQCDEATFAVRIVNWSVPRGIANASHPVHVDLEILHKYKDGGQSCDSLVGSSCTIKRGFANFVWPTSETVTSAVESNGATIYAWHDTFTATMITTCQGGCGLKSDTDEYYEYHRDYNGDYGDLGANDVMT